MPKDLPPHVLALLNRQDFVVTSAQLRELGLSKEAIRWNGARHWRPLLPGVFSLSRETPTPRQRRIAGLLWAGPGSVLGAGSAAEFHGSTAVTVTGRVVVLVEAPKASRRNGFVTVRRTLLHDPDIRVRGPLRASCPGRSFIDAAVDEPTIDRRVAILTEALQRTRVSVDELHEWSLRLRPRDSARVAPALETAAAGAWSAPEGELLELLATSKILPPAWANPGLESSQGEHLLTPDAWFDDVALAIMVHSRAYHEGEAWDATVEKDGELTTHGVVVLGVTPRRIRTAPATTLARIERAWVVAGRRPRPPVVATPRILL